MVSAAIYIVAFCVIIVAAFFAVILLWAPFCWIQEWKNKRARWKEQPLPPQVLPLSKPYRHRPF